MRKQSEFVKSLISKMTDEELAGQLCQSVGSEIVAIGSSMIKEDVHLLIREGKIGSMIQVKEPHIMARDIREYQRIAVEESRLGIPLLFCQDVIHGFETMFPINLAWACSFDDEKIEKAVEIMGREAGKCGINVAFSPMLDVVRDPRWGRVAESFGEDPFLGENIARSHVSGFKKAGIASCLKHFVGYGAAEGGRDYNTCEISENTLSNVYLKPFQSGVDEGAEMVMASFNVINDIPMTCNKHMLKDTLRGKMGFDGVIISDYSALMETIQHRVAENEKDAAKKAFKATLDIEMTTSYYREYLPILIKEGVFSRDELEEAAGRVLSLKEELGLFADPYRFLNEDGIDNFVFSKMNRAFSYSLASESAVLLENNGVLPLTKEKKILLTGPFASSFDQLGCWQFSHNREATITTKQAFETDCYDFVLKEGTGVYEEKENGIADAVEAASGVDVIVACIGEESIISGEACSRQDIVIPKIQEKLLDALYATGKPVVLVVTAGRPLILTKHKEKAAAILYTWFLGSESGLAIKDILTGKVNPSGHLSMSFPYSIGQIPVYYNELSTGRPYIKGSNEHFLSRYLDGPNDPLYAFGYGLSYSMFEVSEPRIEGNNILVDVKNLSEIEGTALVQLYIKDEFASIARPKKELKGYKRVPLKGGEKQLVSFILDDHSLGFRDEDYREIVEKGTFVIMAGLSSRDEELKSTLYEVR